MPRKAQPAPSQRMLRVGEEVRHILSETLRNGGFDDPVLFESANTVTVTEVRVSPDLRYATAYVMTLGGINFDEILPALNDSAWFFQQDIGKKVKMRTTPKVRFVKDDSFDEAQKIENILKGINAE
jgi:ribosome-binding factor A